MDCVLMFPLMFALISSGQSHREGTGPCRETCPPGHHRDASCPEGNFSCKKCSDGLFTEIENTAEQCFRCKSSCPPGEEVRNKCTFERNTKCDCQSGFYRTNSSSICEPCVKCTGGKHRNCECQVCLRRCLNSTECRRHCDGTMTPTAPLSSTATTSTSVSSTNLEPVNTLLWLLPLVVVISLILLWLLLRFTKNLLHDRNSCFIWSANKNLPAENPHCKEQCSHAGSSLTTQTFQIFEETPLMSLSQSPATPAHPAQPGRLLADDDHAVARHEEQSDHWPAIVLYTIIKVVPLRRWKEFLRLLSVADHQLERVELDASLGQNLMEKQYQMLRLWSQRSSVDLTDVLSALCHMDLSGCAQLLQESLEKLEWRPTPKHRGPTDCGSFGAMQGT